MNGTEELLVIYVTAPVALAPKIARTLVEKRLAGCVNIVPKIRSIYCWEDQIQDDEEALLIIKSRASRFDDLSEVVRQEHSYDIPEIIGIPLSHAQTNYQTWLLESVEADGRAG